MPRAWHLKSRPQGMPTPDNFELKKIELPPLADGIPNRLHEFQCPMGFRRPKGLPIDT